MSLTLTAGKWSALSSSPAPSCFWPAGPVFVASVEPLKSGNGKIRLRLVAPLQPLGPLAVTADYRVLRRSADHLVLAADGDGGGLGRTLVIEPLNDRWFVQHWPEMLTRSFNHPSYAESWGVEDVIAAVFGDDEHTVAHGAVASSFLRDPNRVPPPARSVNLPFERTYRGLDACLIRRGYIPQEMEEKWFIHREGDRLIFRRSWTGMIIYAVTFTDADGLFSTGDVSINRDLEQYSETDDAYDLRFLDWLIDRLLLGKSVAFPTKGAPPWRPGPWPASPSSKRWARCRFVPTHAL
jgi:hypothetical protein